MSTIKEASPLVYYGNFAGLSIKDEKGTYYKLSSAIIIANLIGKKIIKASPKKRIYRHIEKLDWSGGQNVG